MSITVKFWGTRGSIPTGYRREELRDRLISALAAATPGDVGDRDAAAAYIDRMAPDRFGGDTTCVEFRNSDGGRVLVDFGSGARVFGGASLAEPLRPYSVLMSHMHWDHVQGFPFFAPAFVPGASIRIGGGHGGEVLKEALLGQMRQPYFPVPPEALQADIGFFDADAPLDLEGFRITPHKLRHGGDAYGYRFDHGGASVVFASDAEHRPEDLNADYPYVNWIRDADLLIFDAQYSLVDLVLHKEDWGHSSGLVAVDLAHLAGVRSILLTHHDPAASDDRIAGMLNDTREYMAMLQSGGADEIAIDAAYDGLVATTP